MKTSDIRKMSNEEINTKITEIKGELWNLRFASASGQLEKPHRINELRKTIARMKTILNERKEEEK